MNQRTKGDKVPEPMKIEVTLDPDVVERLPLRRTTPRNPEEYQMLANGGVDSFPVSLDEFVNGSIRGYPTVEESREKARKQMILSGMQLGYPGYKELWEEEYGE